MNQFGVLGMQMHTQTHMNTHISLQRELLLAGNPVPSTTSAGTWHWIQPQCSGLGCLSAGAAAGCSCPGLWGRQGTRSEASPESRGMGHHGAGGTTAGLVTPWGWWHQGAGGTRAVAGLCHGQVLTCAQAVCWGWGEGMPRVTQCQCLQLSEEQHE